MCVDTLPSYVTGVCHTCLFRQQARRPPGEAKLAEPPYDSGTRTYRRDLSVPFVVEPRQVFRQRRIFQ